MAFGLIIIGDEILAGKRTDQHFCKAIELLSARGLQLGWAEFVGDEPTRIIATLTQTLASEDIVFSCGGIGATPDDHTRQCAAAALGVPLILHQEAKALILERTRDHAAAENRTVDLSSLETQNRLKMGEFPAGAAIVPNPFNKIPGFSVMNTSGKGAHYFSPGFPVMAAPMMEWVLDTHYAHLFHQRPWQERSVLVYETAESTLTPMMEAIERQFDQVKVFSLPHVGDVKIRRHTELGVKGDPLQVAQAFDILLSGLSELGAQIEHIDGADKKMPR